MVVARDAAREFCSSKLSAAREAGLTHIALSHGGAEADAGAALHLLFQGCQRKGRLHLCTNEGAWLRRGGGEWRQRRHRDGRGTAG